nr:FG-GAP repeat protein [Pseudovibrio sp. Ad46]
MEVKLSASDGEKGDRFGVAAINDNGLVVVGAYGDDQNGVAYGGSVYVYTPDGVGGYSEYKLPSLYERERDYWGGEPCR